MSSNPSVYNSFVLLGDFNVNYFCTHSLLYKRLSDCLSPFSLCQVVSSVTHRSPSGTTSLIDLAFVPSLLQVSSFSVVSPLANFDHYGHTIGNCKTHDISTETDQIANGLEICTG